MSGSSRIHIRLQIEGETDDKFAKLSANLSVTRTMIIVMYVNWMIK